uniref:C3H1-type domain-containing protein n=1 Tax=Meloidogyne javanica TaxID=6303 RepID=A0A915LEM8_MELJA
MSDSESNNGTIKTSNIARLKVSICNTWLRKGYCPRGLACIYAHGTDELQDGESDEKKQPTVICKYWFTTGCANRLKFPTIPPPLMAENVGSFGFFHSRRNGNAVGSSSGERLSAKGGNKFQQRDTQDSFDDDDELVLLDKRFNNMENNNVFGSNKNG